MAETETVEKGGRAEELDAERETPAASPAAREEALQPATPPPPPPATPLSGGFPGLAEAWRQSQAATTGARAAMTARDAAVTPIVDEATRRMAARRDLIAATPVPQPPAITAPPSLGLRDFLAPVDGQPPEKTLQSLISAIGLFAGAIGGLARGDAKGAMAALSGAMQGWRDGDRERADRDFKTWQTKSETALKRWETERTAYRDWLDAGTLSEQQMLDGLKLEMWKHGLPVESALFDVQSTDQAWKMLTDLQSHADTLQMRMLALNQSAEKAREDRESKERLAREARESKDELTRLTIGSREETARLARENQAFIAAMIDATKRELGQMNIAAQTAARKDREGFQQQMRDERLAPGTWFNRETGEKAEPTLGDIRQNPDLYKRSNQQGETRWEQITIAKPMIKRLRQLSDKLLADNSPENLIRAAELWSQGKRVSNPDLREFGALVEDVNVKMTSVMGPGQFRVTLFNVLRNVGLHAKDTRESARRILDQWDTNIDNDLRAITGQKLREHIGGPWQGWALSPQGERKWIRIPKGERIEPGWITTEETK